MDNFIIITAFSILVLLVLIGIILEKKAYNKGICPKCGKKLILRDIDSHRDIYYKCENKNYNC